MGKIILAVLGAFFCFSASAGPECTKEPQQKWKNQKAFEQTLKDQGYKIKKFKVTDSNCYEIYGWDKSGKPVEIYFNPVDGQIVKEERKK